MNTSYSFCLQKAVRTTATAALCLFFIAGWGLFFAWFCQICGEVIGGHFADGEQYHGNFYVKAFFRLAYGLALIWIFVNLAEIFFARDGGLKKKAAAAGYSVLAAFFVLAAELSLLFWQERFAPVSYHPYAFWHPQAAVMNADPCQSARKNYHDCGFAGALSLQEADINEK